MESFYHVAVDADVLIYNIIIDGELHTLDELVALDPLMADFKAVNSGNVWCLTKNFYQGDVYKRQLLMFTATVFSSIKSPSRSNTVSYTHLALRREYFDPSGDCLSSS